MERTTTDPPALSHMDDSAHSTVTRLLADLHAGRTDSVDALFEKVYDSLIDLARAQRRHWGDDNTLNTTALVHEAYLKLIDQSKAKLRSRAHFLNTAAKVMRHLLIDYARQRKAIKRGGEFKMTSIDSSISVLEASASFSDESVESLLALDSALKKLSELNEREARVVECRFFAGMSIKETAEVLEVSPMTVKRDWAMALAWLRREMVAAET